ncbi:hypothetical protein PsalN5692_01678 [Piscirickettsia salmonis]|uniref:hypothetical protein n=1 Tax=Piscirickettsia salmonis TaxID=1238 RepID=UPI0012B8A505|nr:hypothetical protein [Piscirickettsia salmonis]QGP50216.1 hypothetical protein PsalN5692_01678 [Piscirickettsia salmonis]
MNKQITCNTLALVIAITALVLAGCNEQQRIKKMPDYQLKKEVEYCQNISQPTQDEKVLCKLYITECAKRQETGRHSCNASLNEDINNRPIKKLRKWD